MLGHKLVQRLSPEHGVFATTRSDGIWERSLGIFDRSTLIENVDAAAPVSIESAFEVAKPDLVINAVGLIKQLINGSHTLDAIEINAAFPHRLAYMCEKYNAKLISISTDCVFDGTKGNYTETDRSTADDVHGRTKYLGEVTGENCLTIRTSIIGRELSSSHSLLEWFMSKRGQSVDGYCRAIFTGFPTVVLADIIADLVVRDRSLNGLYHIASQRISKFELLSIINEVFGLDIEIKANDELAIDRSLNGSKFNTETGFVPLDWRSMIDIMAADETDYDIIRK